MKVIFACGGTGGHINPAIAVAETVKSHSPEADILFVGTERGMESKLVPEYGYDFATIKTSGFLRSFTPKAIFHNIKTLRMLIGASSEAKKIIKKYKPDVVVGTGGYVSGPVVRAAAKLKIPTVIHEQNAFPGVTTKLLSKQVDKVLIAFEAARKYLDKKVKTIVVGNPVREEVVYNSKEEARNKLGISLDKTVILSFGGSLGAKQINMAMAEVMAKYKDEWCFVHATGSFGYKWMPDLLKEKGIEIDTQGDMRVYEYISNMPDYLAAADVVVCRSGAITLSELQVQGKPAVLIPSPNVSENHQFHNAMALVNIGGAEILEEKDLSGAALCEKIYSLANNPNRREQMKTSLEASAIPDASEKIYNEMIKVVTSE